jgi:hypothetical protein
MTYQQLKPGHDAPLDAPLIQGDSRKVINQAAPQGTNNISINERYQTIGIGGLVPYQLDIDWLGWVWQFGAAFAAGMALPSLLWLIPLAFQLLASFAVLAGLALSALAIAADRRLAPHLGGITIFALFGFVAVWVIDLAG